MNERRQRRAMTCVLALILAALGMYLIPAHTVSLWMDWEFTDWVSPIANRLSAHARLYEDGLHSPMPPLPYVLTHLLWPHGARWIDASALNYIFQAGLILLLFHAFAKQMGAARAFICALMATPAYLSLEKTILYDSMAQFLVVVCGITAAGLVCPRPPEEVFSANRRLVQILILGLGLALLLLTKQNTFMGTTIGVCVTMLFLPRTETSRERMGRILTVSVSAGVFFCAIALLLSHWVSFSGFIHDCLLTGSEPKGGPGLLIKRLAYFVMRATVIAGGWGGALALLYWCGRRFSRGLDFRELLDKCCPAILPPVPRRLFLVVLGATLLFGAALLAVWLIATTQAEPRVFIWPRRASVLTLNLGFALAVFYSCCVAIRKCSPKDRDWGSRPLAVYAAIFLFAAMFHTLSVGKFRWSYDNNPLVFSAIGFVVCSWAVLIAQVEFPKFMRHRTLAIGGLAAGMIMFWSVATLQMSLVENCTESWPEIKHLAGARLRPQAEGMRELVETVRTNVNPAKHETVLLLPNDPNVEAWFERERPRQTSAIVFVDQYWDRYVEEDLARLKAKPPKVIVIGPRNYWRKFSHQWKEDVGAERLINEVNETILPNGYELAAEQVVYIRGEKDFMDIYIRRGQ